ncbi:MAG TPA: hypothetical protein VKQ70_06150 [Caulobacteraceae bacterium]|jgi:hypothetical protein|nr:hypothetical protein [Caulobacteraceae bacterium]
MAVRPVLLALLLAPGVALAQDPGNPVDTRVGESFNAAESYQGPLDGSWTLVSASGQTILAFQLVDRPGGQSALEGVWRDLRHPMVPGDIGFIDGIVRGPATLAITLNATPSSPAVTITLHTDPTGAWSGTMHENGADAPVRLRRN